MRTLLFLGDDGYELVHFNKTKFFEPESRSVWTVSDNSDNVAIPVERIIGLPVDAIFFNKGKCEFSNDAILYAGIFKSSRKSTAVLSNGVLILKLVNSKSSETTINIENELKKAIIYERNRQLNQYSKIYYNKIKKNMNFNG